MWKSKEVSFSFGLTFALEEILEEAAESKLKLFTVSSPSVSKSGAQTC